MDSLSEIARRLADNAEAVCRRYLSNGRREGRYWLVGDALNAPGRSLYLRLAVSGDAAGRAGKWTDAESGEHGDLLDIIRLSCGHDNLRETLAEARRFLSLPEPQRTVAEPRQPRPGKGTPGTPAAARRLWAASKPIAGSYVVAYLASRKLSARYCGNALRFHPHCFYRSTSEDPSGTRAAYPAMIAAVTSGDGEVVGVHRTWLDPAGGKAPVAHPRRAMGHLLGHGVRFGTSGPVMAAGEGIETILSVREILPGMPMIAGLSAAHLAAILLPPGLRRLYVALDQDAAGSAAFQTLADRAAPLGIEIVPLRSEHNDFNSDLLAIGAAGLREYIANQLIEADRGYLRFS